jgi:carbon-monoxide dehydrogenase medium subunit
MYMPGPGLPKFDYVKPASLAEASRILTERADAARPVMGGTDLFPKMRDGVVRPDVLVDVKHLPGMGDIVYEEQSGLTIGAAVTMNQLARHPEVRAHYPLLSEAASAVGSYQVRNRATIGGNLCNASPCADTALATLVLLGRVVLYGPGRSRGSDRVSEREMPVAAFFLGPGETALEPGEFMSAIRLPPLPVGAVGRHLKLSRNRLGDLALVSVDVLGFPADEGSGNGAAGAGYTFRVGLGAVAPTVVRATEAEEVLAGSAPGEETFALAAESAAEAAAPIDDVRSGAAYRKAMVRNLTLRGLRDVWARLCDASKVNREG